MAAWEAQAVAELALVVAAFAAPATQPEQDTELLLGAGAGAGGGGSLLAALPWRPSPAALQVGAGPFSNARLMITAAGLARLPQTQHVSPLPAGCPCGCRASKEP